MTRKSEARKQRDADAAVQKKTNGSGDSAETSATSREAAEEVLQAASEHVLALLDGGEEPVNEVVAYFVEKAKEAKEEATVCVRNADQAEQQAAQMRARALELRATFQKYIADIQHWEDRESPDTTVSAEEQPEGTHQ